MLKQINPKKQFFVAIPIILYIVFEKFVWKLFMTLFYYSRNFLDSLKYFVFNK